MPAYPIQTFSTLQQLIDYVNVNFVTNGVNDITGEEGNNILNALASFIESYTLNNSSALVHSTGGAVNLSRPITVFITLTPSEVQWPDNVQNEYYIVNATPTAITLADGFSYFDINMQEKTTIPLRTALHIVKATNGEWVQIAAGGTTVGGEFEGVGLPDQANKNGMQLFTDGSTAFWADPVKSIKSVNFTSATQLVDANLDKNHYEIFWNNINRFLEIDPNDLTHPNSEYKYLTGGGFEILIPGFNASINNYSLRLFLKGKNS